MTDDAASGYAPDHPEVRIVQTADPDEAGGIVRLDATREQLALLARRAKRVDDEEGALLPVTFGPETTRTLAHQCERLAAADDAPIASVTVGGPDASDRVDVSIGVVLSDEQVRQVAADAATAVAEADGESDPDAGATAAETGSDDESGPVGVDEDETGVFRWQLQFDPETAVAFVAQAREALRADEPVFAPDEVDWDAVGEGG